MPGDARLTLGDLIRHQRQRAGMTQAELAKRAGLSSKCHIGMIERGLRVNLEPQIYLGLAKALKIELKAMLEAAAGSDVERGT